MTKTKGAYTGSIKDSFVRRRRKGKKDETITAKWPTKKSKK